MIKLDDLEEAVRYAVNITAQKHKEKYIKNAVREYESTLRAEMARTADAVTTIVKTDFLQDRITVEIRIVSAPK